MATIYECDRCNRQQKEPLYALRYDDDQDTFLPSFQAPIFQMLCTECTRELGTWQRNPKKKFKIQSFEEELNENKI